MTQPVFGRRSVAIAASVVGVSFLTFLVLFVFGDSFTAPASSRSDGYSSSAIGHRAFTRLLEEAGIPTLSSRHDSAKRAGSGLLIVAEPDLDDDDGTGAELFRRLLRHPGPTLVVLPRRRGSSDFAREGWLRESFELDEQDVHRVLHLVDPSLKIVRRSVGSDRIEARDPGPAPTFEGPAQLLRPSPNLDPLVTVGDQVLLARVLPERTTDAEVVVLSDPDFLATHGLVRGSNAAFLVAVVARLHPDGSGAVVIDETLHGYDLRPSLWAELFRAPLVFATISALLAALVLGAAGLGRFGRARPLPPAIAPGKRFLVAHTADLVREAGHAGLALDRYLAASIADAGRSLHAPAHLDAAGLRAWLRREGAPRAGTRPFSEVEGLAKAAVSADDPRTVLEAARAVHTWREATKHGHRIHS